MVAKEYRTIPGTAKRTRLSEQQIARDIRNGKIKAEKISRDWLISPEEAERLSREFPIEEANPLISFPPL